MQSLLGRVSTSGVRQLEGPQEVGGLLEVGADGVDLVDEILHADNAELAEGLLDDRVVGQGDALLVDLAVSALVDELANRLEVGLTVGDVGVDELEHLGGGLGQADEDTVVDLEKTQQLEDLAGLGGNVVDTLDADDEGELGLGGNVERTSGLGLATETDLVTLLGAVLTDVLVGALEDDLALGLAGLAGSGISDTLLSGSLVLGLSLLQEGLGNENVLKGGGGAVDKSKIRKKRTADIRIKVCFRRTVVITSASP